MTVTFVQSPASVAEGSSLQVCAELSSGAAIPVTVPLTVEIDSAQQNVDFTISSQSFDFPVRSAESCIIISSVDDAILEEDEVLTLVLQSSDTVVAVQGTLSLTITDQDSTLTIIV